MKTILGFVLCISAVSIHTNVIVIDETFHNSSLYYYLCEPAGQSLLKPGTYLVLTHATMHILPLGSFCLITATSNITIRSGSSHTPAVITCTKYDAWHSRGFGFFNVSNLYIEGLHIINCGDILPSFALMYPHDKLFYFHPNQSTSLIFSHCINTTISKIKISFYFGFSAIFINPSGFTSIQDITVMSSHGEIKCSARYNISCTGTGIVLFYSYLGNGFGPPMNSTFGLHNVILAYNINSFLRMNRTLNLELVATFPISALSGGLTVIYSHGFYSANVTVTDIRIKNTYGGYFGGIAVIFHDYLSNDLTMSKFNLLRGKFDHGIIHSKYSFRPNSGVGIYVHFKHKQNQSQTTTNTITWQAVNIKDCIFYERQSATSKYDFFNRATNEQAALIIATHPSANTMIKMFLSNLTYRQVFSGFQNPFLYAETVWQVMSHTKNLELHLLNIFITQSSHYQTALNVGKITLKNIAAVFIDGNVNIFKDQTGSIILAHNTDIHLKGTALFENNKAGYGAALCLESSSFLYLYDTTNITFKDNSAMFFGGAISSNQPSTMFTNNRFCTIQLAQTIKKVSDLGKLLHFEGNTAMLAGNSIYITDLYECKQHYAKTDNMNVLYHKIFTFKRTKNTTNKLAQMSSAPFSVCLCDYTGNNIACNKNVDTFYIYPGAFLTVGLVAMDKNNTITYAKIITTVSFNSFSQPKFTNWRLGKGESIQYVSGSSCTPLTYKIDLHGLSKKSLQLLLAVPDTVPTLKISVFKLECPIGFYESNHLCTCNSFLKKVGITQCDIDTTSVTLSPGSWLGTINTNQAVILGYSSQCPTGYCKPLLTTINITWMDVICTGNRRGILCGQCMEDYSVVFGSSDCYRCSNESLYVIGVYVLVGIVYVLMLYVLRFTIDIGTVSGLVFWLDIVSITQVPLPKQGYNHIIKWMNIFTHSLHFQVETPICLYDGLAALHKGAFLFALPIYLWLLVAVIALLSRCSSFIANMAVGSSVQVLATLMHISLSELFVVSMDTLIPAQVQIDTNTTSSILVWYIDGNVRYGENIFHIILLIVSLLTLLLFVLPYIVCGLLSCPVGWRCLSLYLRPFIDTLHGPYRDNVRYWFGLRLLVLTVMYIIYVILRDSNVNLQFLLFALILGSFIIAQANVMPFKKIFINILDLWFMVLLEINFIMSLFFNKGGNALSESIVGLLLVGTGLVSCILVLLYHIAIKLKQIRLIKSLCYKIGCMRLWKKCVLIFKRQTNQYEHVVDNESDDESGLRSPLQVLSPFNQF